jgi:hypothetical protein
MLRSTAGSAIFIDAAEDSFGFASLLGANVHDGALLGTLEAGDTHLCLQHLEDCVLQGLGGHGSRLALHADYKIIHETQKVNPINNPISLFTINIKVFLTSLSSRFNF